MPVLSTHEVRFDFLTVIADLGKDSYTPSIGG